MPGNTRLSSPSPGAADSVQRAPRGAEDGVQPGPQPRGARSCADPCPTRAPLPQPPLLKEWTLRRRISSPPAWTSHWVPNGCKLRGGGGAGRRRRGFQTGGGGEVRGGTAVHHRPRPPPTTIVGRPEWGGPVCAPPVGSGYLASRRKACGQEGAWPAAYAPSGTNRIKEQPRASGLRGGGGVRWRRTRGAGARMRC